MVESRDVTYLCEFCKRSFASRQSKSRHVKLYCKKKSASQKVYAPIYQNSLFEVIYELQRSNKILQENTAELAKEIRELKSNPRTVVLNETKNYRQYNNTQYVFKFCEYEEADDMESLVWKFYLTEGEFERALECGYSDALIEKVENVIITPYLQNVPCRPIHTVDLARKRALYKDKEHIDWTIKPAVTLDHCLKEFHDSVLEHQMRLIQNAMSTCHISKIMEFSPVQEEERRKIHSLVKNFVYQRTLVDPDRVGMDKTEKNEVALIIKELHESGTKNVTSYKEDV
jgi:hypothetical protein